MEVAKALGGLFKLVMLVPRTVREMTQLPKETQKGVFLVNHLTSIDNLTSNNQEIERIQTQTNVNTNVLINNNIHTQKSMLTERTDKPGVVAFYDIRPGNGVGLF